MRRIPDPHSLRWGQDAVSPASPIAGLHPKAMLHPALICLFQQAMYGTGNSRDIWENSDLFDSIRKPALKGKCGECVYRLLCGGCRARAYAAHKDYLAEDPWCGYIPRGGEVIKPPSFEKEQDDSSTMMLKPVWTREAEERLKRVPSFVRAMVRSAVERYASEHHCGTITPDIMEELKQKAGMGGMHGHR